MVEKHLPADEAHRLLDRLTELDQSAGLRELWCIELEPHDYSDGTTHFTHVRTTGYVQGEPVNVSVGSHLTPALAELLVTMRNNLPELIRLARMRLKDQS
jgi:hypothetical protein